MKNFKPHISRYAGMAGFSMAQVTLAMSLLAGAVVFTVYQQKVNFSIDQARTVAQQYQTINNAVNNYIVTYATSLAKIDSACSQTTFGAYVSAQQTLERRVAKCELVTSQSLTVANGLQPTAAELIKLGFLTNSPTNPTSGLPLIALPNMDVKYIVKEAKSDGTKSDDTTPYTTARLFVNIELVCLPRLTPTQSNSSYTPAPGSGGCPAATTTTGFKSLVFNTQPYIFKTSDRYAQTSKFTSLISAIGMDALASELIPNVTFAQKGELYGKNLYLKNPIRYIDSKLVETGIPGIIAIRGGYGAAYANYHSRTDGSNVPTADWSFGSHNILDVNKLETDAIKTNKLKIPLKVAGTACDRNIEDLARQDSNILLCKDDLWTVPINAIVNSTEYYELTYTGTFEKDTTIHIHDVKIWLCSNNRCLPSVKEMAKITYGGTATVNISTTLKYTEWIPIVTTYRSQILDFSIYRDLDYFVISILPGQMPPYATLFTVRFYKGGS